ncbi:MAG: Gfo/Idh/MocA family oxidoreductase [Bacteroidota bacterium]
MGENKTPKTFALIGAAGYIAPRHLAAIKATQNRLVAALDPSDSVGILDRYFPNASFFTEFERFDRHLDRLQRQGTNIDYLSICSPNYLHDAHIRFGLRIGANVICEKPLVINPWNVVALQEKEQSNAQKIYTILQLRHHPTIKALKQKVANEKQKIYDVNLTYITARGNWYYASWKGDETKSGGITANIGIHFFDMLLWIFGAVKSNEVHVRSHDRAAGYLELERAKVKWFLSINRAHLPDSSKSVHRSIHVDEEELEFTEGFTDLHTQSYQAILDGKGFRIQESQAAIQLVHQIRTKDLVVSTSNQHSLSRLPLQVHPFSVTN